MKIKEYWEKKFKEEVGELNEDDKKVLQNTIEFFEASKKIGNLI
jgi:hypothetical protein